jgi:HSP20 family molecular chaperone IbpA
MKWGEALGCLRAARAPDTDPDVRSCRVSWHNNRAAALLQLGQHPEAEAAATEVLALETSNLKALFRRGTARASQFKWLGAVRDLEKVVELSPKNSKAAAQLEQAREQLEKHRQAEEEAEMQKAAEAEAALRAAKEEKRKASEAKMQEAAKAAAEAAAGGDAVSASESARKAAEDAYWADKMEQMAAASASDTQKQKAKRTSKGEKGGKQQPEHELTKTTEGFKLVISLPGTKSMKGVDIDVSEDEFVLESADYKLRLYLPQAVDVDAVSAKFSKKSNSLSVQLTRLVSTLDIDASDRLRTGAKEHLDDQDSFERAAYAPPENVFGDAETDAMMEEMARVMGEGSSAGGGGGMDMGAGMQALLKETMEEHKKQQRMAAAH